MQALTLLTSVATLLAYTASPAQAADNRQLVNFPGGDGKSFCDSWRCACINYVPTSSDLTNFQSAYCQPGDFSGKNTNNTARVFCTWQHADGSQQSVIKHIEAKTGATPKSS